MNMQILSIIFNPVCEWERGKVIDFDVHKYVCRYVLESAVVLWCRIDEDVSDAILFI